MRKVLAFALWLSVAGCGSEPSGLAADVAGTYSLATVDGSPPPFVYIEAPGYQDVILGGLITLSPDGTFTDATNLRTTRDAVMVEKSVILRGTWELEGFVVVFTPDPRVGRGRPYTMSFREGRLTLVEAGVTSIFERAIAVH
jgi:hypothetical protein